MLKIVIACGENAVMQLPLLRAAAQISRRIFGGYWPSHPLQVFDLEINCTLIVVKSYLEMMSFLRYCCLLGCWWNL